MEATRADVSLVRVRRMKNTASTASATRPTIPMPLDRAGGVGGRAGVDAVDNGLPHCLHLTALAGFDAPHVGHFTSGAGPAWNAPSARPASRVCAVVKSPPHWVQAFASAGLRAPQSGR